MERLARILNHLFIIRFDKDGFELGYVWVAGLVIKLFLIILAAF